MPDERVRTHVVLPRDVVAEVDALVGRGRRSDFISTAVEEKLARLRRSRIAREFAGSLKDTDIPGWESPEAAVAWVRSMRETDARREHGDTGA